MSTNHVDSRAPGERLNSGDERIGTRSTLIYQNSGCNTTSRSHQSIITGILPNERKTYCIPLSAGQYPFPWGLQLAEDPEKKARTRKRKAKRNGSDGAYLARDGHPTSRKITHLCPKQFKCVESRKKVRRSHQKKRPSILCLYQVL